MLITNSKCNYTVTIQGGGRVVLKAGTCEYPEIPGLKEVVEKTQFLSFAPDSVVERETRPPRKTPNKKGVKKQKPAQLDNAGKIDSKEQTGGGEWSDRHT